MTSLRSRIKKVEVRKAIRHGIDKTTTKQGFSNVVIKLGNFNTLRSPYASPSPAFSPVPKFIWFLLTFILGFQVFNRRAFSPNQLQLLTPSGIFLASVSFFGPLSSSICSTRPWYWWRERSSCAVSENRHRIAVAHRTIERMQDNILNLHFTLYNNPETGPSASTITSYSSSGALQAQKISPLT